MLNGQCDKLATVVGRQFITLSVHLCVQHHGRNAARRTGLSVAAETCKKGRSNSKLQQRNPDKIWKLRIGNKNSSEDEIANVNFLRRYGTYVLQNTKKENLLRLTN